ncbi:MAG: hypothetical protein KTR16_11110 [Acidiferrobacterales bacterium]|nr:hypothetical protein [Acidiferrobacterales bacterium]
MNYLCSYWLNPESNAERESELRRYFDLQCYLKQRMGNTQVIVSNIDYPSAVAFELPLGFNSKFAMFTRFFALKQMILAGLEFPICCHDHDFFNARPLEHDPDHVLVSALVNGYFSDQVIVFPESSKQAIFDFVNTLEDFDYEPQLQSGYGTEIRHEGQYSTEQSYAHLNEKPFQNTPMRQAYNVLDQVSFDILDQHSLDHGTAKANDIPDYCHGVHGHVNKGQATEILLNWLSKQLSQ